MFIKDRMLLKNELTATAVIMMNQTGWNSLTPETVRGQKWQVSVQPTISVTETDGRYTACCRSEGIEQGKR